MIARVVERLGPRPQSEAEVLVRGGPGGGALHSLPLFVSIALTHLLRAPLTLLLYYLYSILCFFWCLVIHRGRLGNRTPE